MFSKVFFVLAAASSAFATVSVSRYVLCVPTTQILKLFLPIKIIQPIATTVFNGGQQATIQWQESGSAPSLAQFGPAKVSIYTGNSQQQVCTMQNLAAYWYRGIDATLLLYRPACSLLMPTLMFLPTHRCLSVLTPLSDPTQTNSATLSLSLQLQ